MLKKTLLCGALALITMSPLVVSADTVVTAEVKNAPVDTVTTAKIKGLYLLSPLIKTLSITVVTTNHDVTLTGTVDTLRKLNEMIFLLKRLINTSA